MKRLTIALILAISSQSLYAITLDGVQTCVDAPAVKAGSGFGVCKKYACGPMYNTDMVRTNDPSDVNKQSWESWATLASTRAVVGCSGGTYSGWTVKSAISINPPAPPTTTPPPVPKVGNFNITWSVPTKNADGTALTAGTTFTYTIQHASLAIGPWDTSFSVNTLAYQYKNLPTTIQHCFAVAAISSTPANSPSAPSALSIICASANSVPTVAQTPGAVGSLQVTTDASGIVQP